MPAAVVLGTVLVLALSTVLALNVRRHHTETLFVTAFKDLEREKWPRFGRTVGNYFERFQKLVALPIPLVVYVDTKTASHVRAAVKGRRFFTEVIVVTSKALAKMGVWSLLGRECEIMQSKKYLELTSHRRTFPENNNPRYTMINHAKVDFVHDASHRFPQFPYLAWVDFGYIDEGVQIRGVLDPLAHNDPSKVTYGTNKWPEGRDGDPIYTLKTATMGVEGNFFWGSAEAHARYREKYHETLRRFQRRGIADDDQAVAINIAVHHPELINLKKLGTRRAFQHCWV